MYDAHDKIYEVILSTAAAHKYLSDFLEEPLPEGAIVTIVFDLVDKACSFDFSYPGGYSSPQGFSDDWEGSLHWLDGNGYAKEAAEIRALMEDSQ